MYMVTNHSVTEKSEFSDLASKPQVNSKKVCENRFPKKRMTAMCDRSDEVHCITEVESSQRCSDAGAFHNQWVLRGFDQ